MTTHRHTAALSAVQKSLNTQWRRVLSRCGLVILLSGVFLAGGPPPADGLGSGSPWGQHRPFTTHAGHPAASIWYVDWEGNGDNNGSSWDDAFVDLQAALDAAASGDEIWVAEGTYYPSVEHGGTGDRYQSFQMLNGVGIYGGFDPSIGDTGWDDRDWRANETILSGDIGVPDSRADNCYHVFYHPAELGLDPTAILDGFALTMGNADGPGALARDGGGMLNVNASPTLANCKVESNEAYDNGAGLYNESSSPLISNCTFRLNKAGWDGGAIHNSESLSTVENSTFVDNSALGMGGAVFSQDSSILYTGCTFLNNEAGYGGGGVVNWGRSATLIDCVFQGNLATSNFGEGGGVHNSGSTVFLTNCIFALNQALSGGAVYTWGRAPRFTNCTFYSNSAQEGGALSNASNASPVVVNSILWADSPDEISGGFPIVMYSDVQGSWPGEGNIDEDPLLVDPGEGDYHLAADSPCVDAGTNDAPYLPPTDFEGDDRIMDGDHDGTFVVDMGADERLGALLEPITDLEASNDSPTPLGSTTTLTATITTGTGVSYIWNLGDGDFDNGAMVTHTYGAVGTCTAVVTATNPLGNATAATTVTIEEVPIEGLEAVNDSPTVLGSTTNLTATVSAGSNVTYAWAFGDGTPGSGPNVTHLYPDVGVYTATVTATNSVGFTETATLVTITPASYPTYLPLVLREH